MTISISQSFSSVPILTIGFFIVRVRAGLIIENDFQRWWRDRCRETIVERFSLILVVTVNMSSHFFPEIYNEWNPIEWLCVFIFIDLACICKTCRSRTAKAQCDLDRARKNRRQGERERYYSVEFLCAPANTCLYSLTCEKKKSGEKRCRFHVISRCQAQISDRTSLIYASKSSNEQDERNENKFPRW